MSRMSLPWLVFVSGSGGVLAGTGAVASVVVNAAGRVVPGNGIGTLTALLPFGILSGSLIFGPIVDRFGVEVGHVRGDVGHEALPGKRLDLDRLACRQRRHFRVASQHLAAVDPDAARAARGMHARMADDQRPILIPPNLQQRVQNGRGRSGLDFEGVEMGFDVAALGTRYAQSSHAVYQAVCGRRT